MAKRRPNGDGLVRKRADGRWEGRIVVGHKEDGKPIYRSVFAEKQSDLMPKLHELKDQYAGVELTEDREVIVKFRFAHLDETAENQAPQAAAPSETAQISGTSHLQ